MLTWFFSFVAGATPLPGSYLLSEPREQLERTHLAALEAGIEQLPWAIRPFARPRLQGAVRNCRRLVLSLSPSTFESSCDQDKPLRLERGRSSQTVTADDGKPYTVTLALEPEEAAVSFSGEEGGQRFFYTLQPDGNLLLRQEIFSPWLSKPIVWTARYRRSEQP